MGLTWHDYHGDVIGVVGGLLLVGWCGGVERVETCGEFFFNSSAKLAKLKIVQLIKKRARATVELLPDGFFFFFLFLFFIIFLFFYHFAFAIACLEALEQQRLAAIGEGLIDPFDVGLGETHRLILSTVGFAAVDTLELDIGATAAGQRAAHIKFAGIELGGAADASSIGTAVAARLRRCLRHMHDGALLVNCS